jgi:hypothetical protein
VTLGRAMTRSMSRAALQVPNQTVKDGRSYSGVAAGQPEDFLLVGDCFLGTCRLVQQVQVELVIVGHASHGVIRVLKALRIVADPDSRQAETRQGRERDPALVEEVCNQSDPTS